MALPPWLLFNNYRLPGGSPEIKFESPVPLTEWWVQTTSPYVPPEISRAKLVGRRRDGKRIITSNIAEVIDKTTIRTKSGTVYEITGPQADHMPEQETPPFKWIERILKLQKETS